MAGVGPGLGLGRAGGRTLSGDGLLGAGHTLGGYGLGGALDRLCALHGLNPLYALYPLNSRYEDGLAEGADLRGHLLRATGGPVRRDGALCGDVLSDRGLSDGGLSGAGLGGSGLCGESLPGGRLPGEGLPDGCLGGAPGNPLRSDGLTGSSGNGGLGGWHLLRAALHTLGGKGPRAAQDSLGGHGLRGGHRCALREHGLPRSS